MSSATSTLPRKTLARDARGSKGLGMFLELARAGSHHHASSEAIELAHDSRHVKLSDPVRTHAIMAAPSV